MEYRSALWVSLARECRALRPSFLAKIWRTNPFKLYGLRTLLSGTLVPARLVGAGAPAMLRQIADEGHEVAPHGWDHVGWQDRIPRLDAVAIRTHELIYTNRFGQEIWREPRGIDAGYDVPQFSVHRGRLQGVIHQAVRSRLGESRLHTGHRLGGFAQDESGVTAWFFDRNGSHRRTAHGDVLIGADGIHQRTVAGKQFLDFLEVAE